MYSWKHVMLLLLINILLIGFILYFFDYMNIIDYKEILSNIKVGPQITAVRIDDPLLLEREELQKKWEVLTIKTTELSNQEQIINSNKLALETSLNELNEKREAFLNEQALVKLKEEEKNAYDIKITDVATQIAGMPPQTAAELLNLQDDLQVVDIFKKMDQIAIDNGQASTVPFLLTLLEREKAARVQSLMLVGQTP
ncbi:MAG: periplasmic-type flagellar collar protein FlbB [Brevinema sp.]